MMKLDEETRQIRDTDEQPDARVDSPPVREQIKYDFITAMKYMSPQEVCEVVAEISSLERVTLYAALQEYLEETINISR